MISSQCITEDIYGSDIAPRFSMVYTIMPASSLPPVLMEAGDSKKPYGFYPYHAGRRIWEYIMYACSLLVIWELPFEWCFDFKLNFLWIIPSLIIDCIFLADIFITTRTGVLHYGVVELDKESILSDISMWKRVIAWLAPWPYYLIGVIIENKLVFRILVTLKVIRLFRLYQAQNTIKNTLIYISPVSKMALLFSVLFTIVHVCACIFWYVGNRELPGESWLTDVVSIADKPQFVQYLHTVYYVTTTILTIGYGDIHPVTFPEICVVICIEACGVFFYNYLVSSMVSIVANPSKNHFLSKYQRVYSAFKWRGVSDDSLRELLRYYEYVWERDRDRADFYETAQKMPESLQKRIAMALHMEAFNKLEFLRDCDTEILEQLALALKPRIFTPGDFLIKAGRVSDKMLFLTEGVVDLINIEGAAVGYFDKNAKVVLGESSLVLGTEEVVSAVARTYVESFELLKEDFDEVAGLCDLFRAHTMIEGDVSMEVPSEL